jgi:hypothetical protein
MGPGGGGWVKGKCLWKDLADIGKKIAFSCLSNVQCYKAEEETTHIGQWCSFINQ